MNSYIELNSRHTKEMEGIENSAALKNGLNKAMKNLLKEDAF